MPADYDFYTRLEPNHDVEIDDDGFHLVLCPFEPTDDGRVVLHDHPVSVSATWSPSADPGEIDCLRCEVFNGALHLAGPPPHEHAGEDELEEDGPDRRARGAARGKHHISEYTPCKVPLRRIEFVRGVMVTVHEGAVASLGRIRDRYEDLDGYRRYPIRQRVTAFFVCRKTVSGSSWSKHALCAGDINWDKNPYGRTLITDMPPWFRQLFLDEGWGWGGDWQSVKDAMHFSKSLNEGGDGWLYVGSIDEEDEMAQLFENRAAFDEAVQQNLRKVLDESPLQANRKGWRYGVWKALHKLKAGKKGDKLEDYDEHLNLLDAAG